MNVDDSSYPRLEDFVRVEHDATRERWVLQGPERVLVLDETSKEILDRCTGKTTVKGIVEGLSAEYDAPQEMINHDVNAVLVLLLDKRFLVLSDEPTEV